VSTLYGREGRGVRLADAPFRAGKDASQRTFLDPDRTTTPKPSGRGAQRAWQRPPTAGGRAVVALLTFRARGSRDGARALCAARAGPAALLPRPLPLILLRRVRLVRGEGRGVST